MLNIKPNSQVLGGASAHLASKKSEPVEQFTPAQQKIHTFLRLGGTSMQDVQQAKMTPGSTLNI